MAQDHESTKMTYSDETSLKARSELFSLLNTYQATESEKERSLGLFIRGSLLARILAIQEIYKQIVPIPGTIVDLGTWRGQTAVLCENFRAIFEPLNFNRRIACFDTFEGYAGFSDKDRATEIHRNGTYKVEKNYAKYLENLLVIHEKNNAMGHNHGKHKVIQGDCRVTLPKFFKDNPNEFVALAFFDLNSFEPTLDSFKLMYKKLVPGGIIAFWQLTRDTIPAEGSVYSSEIIGAYAHKIRRSQFYPGLCYLKKV